jgi:hypothetical protein
VLHKSIGRVADRVAAHRPRVGSRTACTPRSLCVRCAMVTVITYRFGVFKRTFGRMPELHEPIFFVTNSTMPVLAPREEFRKQLSEATKEMGVRLAPLLRLLKLD